MWNYPFDPNEIEGENRESTFGEAMWVIAVSVLAIVTVTYFGGHFIAFILK